MKAAKAGLSSPEPLRSRPSPAQLQTNASSILHQERGRNPGSPAWGSLPGVKPRRGSRRKGTESSRLVQKWRRAESRPLRKRGGEEELGGRERPGLRPSGAQTEPPPALRAPKRGPAVGRGRRVGREVGGGGGGAGRASGGRRHPFIPPSKGTRVHTHTPTHPHPRRLDPRGRAARLRLRPQRHLEKSPRPAPRHPGPRAGEGTPAHRALSRPAKPPGALGAEPAASPRCRPGARPEIAGLPTSKRRPAHQSARAARLPRPPHSPLIRWRTPCRDLAGAAGRAPARVPRWTRRGSPGPPPGSPGHGEHGGISRRRRRGCAENNDPEARASSAPGRGACAPLPLLCKRSEWASAPAAAAPRPLQPPARPAFNPGPVSSSH